MKSSETPFDVSRERRGLYLRKNLPSSLRQKAVWTLLIVLILAAAGELGFRGFRRALSDMQDFAVIYSSTRAFENGQNPYDSSAMQAAWLQANHHRPTDPNPVDLALYPPATYLLLSPLALLDWAQVRWAWLLIDLVSVAVLLVVLVRYWPGQLQPWKAACAAAFILGFGPIHTAIAKGQLTVLVTALLALAVVAQSRNAAVLAAIFIALAACLKPQVAAPIVLLYLVQRNWKAILVVAGVVSALVSLAWFRLSWAGVSWLPSLLRNIGLASKPGGVYDPSPTNPLAFQLVNASALLHRFISNNAAITIFLAGIFVAVSFLLWKRGRSVVDLLADPTAFSAACVLGLALIAHRYYDAAVLVFVFAWALGSTSSSRRIGAWISIAACLLMAFPIPALLIGSGHARAPSAIPQALWDAFVIHQQNWAILIVLIALSCALPGSEIPQKSARVF
jgi:Glycosyltransferase family 87